MSSLTPQLYLNHYPLNWSMLGIYTIMATLVPAGQMCTIKIIRKCHYHPAQWAIINSLPSNLWWYRLIQIPKNNGRRLMLLWDLWNSAWDIFFQTALALQACYLFLSHWPSVFLCFTQCKEECMLLPIISSWTGNNIGQGARSSRKIGRA